MALPTDQLGIGTETAQAISGGAFAAGMREYLRPALGWKKRVFAALLCVAGAVEFGDDVAAYTGLSLQLASAIAGLVCIALAEGALKAAETIDFGAYFRKAQP